jgi:hypothetical protein
MRTARLPVDPEADTVCVLGGLLTLCSALLLLALIAAI